MLFADDIVLVRKTKAELGGKLSRWKKVLEDKGFKISRTKTEYLWFNGRADGEEMRMDDEIIKRVPAFKYLSRIFVVHARDWVSKNVLGPSWA